MDELSDLLKRAQDGNEQAREQLFAVTYQELRSLARAQLRNGGGRNTILDTTVLVHESYLRIRNAARLTGTERGQFFAYAARTMRSVIVDFARHQQAERRRNPAQGDLVPAQLAESIQVGEDEVIRLNDALESLQKHDPRLVQVVEMRYFAGMTEIEVADALSISDRTVRRHWEKARVLLFALLR